MAAVGEGAVEVVLAPCPGDICRATVHITILSGVKSQQLDTIEQQPNSIIIEIILSVWCDAKVDTATGLFTPNDSARDRRAGVESSKNVVGFLAVLGEGKSVRVSQR